MPLLTVAVIRPQQEYTDAPAEREQLRSRLFSEVSHLYWITVTRSPCLNLQVLVSVFRHAAQDAPCHAHWCIIFTVYLTNCKCLLGNAWYGFRVPVLVSNVHGRATRGREAAEQGSKFVTLQITCPQKGGNAASAIRHACAVLCDA